MLSPTLEPQALPLSIASARKSRDLLPLALTIAIFAALSLAAAIKSPGFLEADSCTHYLYARAAWAHPAYLANVWGRPICTALYALPAHLGGRLAVRFTSLLTAIALALVAREIAKGQKDPTAKDTGWNLPTLALICTLAQPLVFLHSFSELTELPFALLLAVAFWAYQRRQFFWLAAIIAITPLSRPEGFGFLALAAAALLLHRRWYWLAILPIPLILWDYAGWHLNGQPGPWPGAFPWFHWLRANWPYAETSLYDRKPLFQFVVMLPAIVSPLLFPAMLVGIGLCLHPWRSLSSHDHRRRCNVLIAIIPLMILVGHSLLAWRGKMASNGEIRYMLIVAAFWGLLSARGWTWLFQTMRWPRPIAWAALAALAPILANHAYRVVPIRSQPDWTEAQQIARWYAADGHMSQYPHLLVAHPGIIYHLDSIPAAQGRAGDWRKAVIDSLPAQTLLIWDPIYGVYNSDSARSVTKSEILAHGWKPLTTLWDGPGTAGGWQAFVSSAEGAKATPYSPSPP